MKTQDITEEYMVEFVSKMKRKHSNRFTDESDYSYFSGLALHKYGELTEEAFCRVQKEAYKQSLMDYDDKTQRKTIRIPKKNQVNGKKFIHIRENKFEVIDNMTPGRIAKLSKEMSTERNEEDIQCLECHFQFGYSEGSDSCPSCNSYNIDFMNDVW